MTTWEYWDIISWEHGIFNTGIQKYGTLASGNHDTGIESLGDMILGIPG
jgi:hypothetical protein